MTTDKHAICQFNERSVYADFEEFRRDAEDCESRVEYSGFAFLAGCVWGDDTCWKLRYIDYKGIANKVLLIDDRFGYHPLPTNRLLAECVDLSGWEPTCPIIFVSKREQFCFQEAPAEDEN